MPSQFPHAFDELYTSPEYDSISAIEHRIGITESTDPNSLTFQVTALQREPSGTSVQALQVADLIFNEPAGPSADLTATLPVLAGTTVLDVLAVPLVGPWADGSSVLITMGDGANPTGYFDGGTYAGVGQYATYSSTGTGDSGADFVGLGYRDGPGYSAVAAWSMGGRSNGYSNSVPGIIYAADDTITAALSGISTGGGGGKLLVRIYYIAPTVPIVAA